jgi:penicillin G amidase
MIWLAMLASLGPGAPLGDVEIVRDRWGVPNVFAETDEGAMYGLGYACAQDRGLQMHLKVRIMQGRLAEVLGNVPGARRPEEGPVWSDRRNRTLGWARSASDTFERLQPRTRGLLQAYSDGVNAFYRENRGDLHEVYGRIGLEPEEWKPEHSILAWWHLGQFFAGDGSRKLVQWHGERGLSAEDRQRMPGRVVDDEAAVVQREDVDDAWVLAIDAFLEKHGLESGAAGLLSLGQEAPKFSHAWVVGRGRSTDGSATLVSDPQTPVSYPSLLYEFHVKSPGLHARGVGVPGAPSLLIGFTPHVAWGLTALGADQTELFMLRTRGDQYELDGEWRPMEVSNETIHIKGESPVGLRVRRTHFGPVFTEFALPRPNDPEVALKRVPLTWSGSDAVEASLEMMGAADRPEFVRALAKWNFPSANIVFGHKNGDIGYWTIFANPIRSSLAIGAAAQPGHSAAYDWQGFVPFELLPHVVNPKRGTVFSGNHRPIASFYRIPLGNSTGAMGHSSRSWRLSELLESKARFSPEDVLEMHYDAVHPGRRELVRIAQMVRQRAPQAFSPGALRAAEGLSDWLEQGASMDLSRPGAVQAMGVDMQFRPMGSSLASLFGGGESGLSLLLRSVRARMEADPKAMPTRDELAFLDAALSGAGGSGRGGSGRGEPVAGGRGAAPPPLPALGAFSGLDGLASLDRSLDVAIPTLRVTDGGTIHSQRQQAYTQWVPMADPDRALAILPPGNSEDPRSPHRTSALEDWAESRLRPAPLSRESVLRNAESTRKIPGGPGGSQSRSHHRN